MSNLLPALRRYLWILVLAVVFVVMWARQLTLPADLLVFDLAATVVSQAQPRVDAQVVIVRAGSAFSDASVDWTALLGAIARQRARCTVLLMLPVGFDPRSAGADGADGAAGEPCVLLGRPTAVDADGRLSEVVWPAAFGSLEALPDGLQVAPMLPLEAGGGVHYRARIRADAGQPSIELAAAVAGGARAFEDSVMMPDFSRRLLFPVLDVAQVIDGGVPGNLLQGRTVIIVRERTSQTPLLKVPGRTLTPDEFRAQAIDNLIRGQRVQELPVALGAALILLWSVVLLLFFSRASARDSMYAALVLALSVIGAALLLLALARFWLPLGELLAILLGVWIATRYVDFAQQQLRVGELSRQLTLMLRSRVLPDEVLTSPDYWDNVGSLLYQLLDLRRSIFLERVEGDHRLQEIHAINANINEIDERRRDYEREPYRGALALGGPLAVTDYLEDREGDMQFLAPLVFDNTVAGFWAVSIDSDMLERQADFLRVIDAFSDEIAELVYRRSALQRARPRRPLLDGLLEGRSGRTLRTLGTAVTLAGKRIESVEQAFVGLDSAVVVYDVFGRVVLANNNIEALLSRWDLRVYDLSYVDLLGSLTGHGLDQARLLMKSVVLDGETLHLRVHPPQAGDTGPADAWLLHVHGIVDPDENTLAHEHPFKVACIAFELVDLEAVGRTHALKADLLSRLADALAADGSTLAEPVQRAARLLTSDVGTSGDGLFPVALAGAWEELCSGAGPLLAERRLTLEPGQDGDRGGDVLVMAAPERLVSTLQAVLRFVAGDARPGTRLTWALRDQPASLTLRNEGIGMPQAQLERFLSDAQARVPEDLEDLRAAVMRLQAWGGQVHITSEVGVGLKCRIEFDSLEL